MNYYWLRLTFYCRTVNYDFLNIVLARKIIHGFKKNILFQLEHGISGLLAGGTTGEAPTLDLDEFELLIQAAARTIQKKVPLIVSIGESATKRSLMKMEIATDLGADALLVATPAYNKPSQEGLYEHFKAIAAS